SRIFQHKTVPEILKELFKKLIDVTFEIQGTFEPREYCVQYRESDFHFVSRLMEEEGIYYFFSHTPDGHKMTVANTPQSQPDVIPSTVVYEEASGGNRKEDRVSELLKIQELRSGKEKLWNY